MEVIARAMEENSKDHLIKACSSYRTPIESVREAEGGYLEWGLG